MMETVRIRRSGYPVRRSYEDFMFRYSVLGRGLVLAGGGGGGGERERCQAILRQHESSCKDWQLGKTKVRHATYSAACCLIV